MKTFIEKLIITFEHITNPAAGWFKTNASPLKQKNKRLSLTTLSPEGYNVRGFSKKTASNRRTPAP